MTRKQPAKRSKLTTPKPAPWGLTLADATRLLGTVTGGPASEADALALLEGGQLDDYILLDELVAGRLRFDPAVAVWMTLVGELSLWMTTETITPEEAREVMRQCAPGIPEAFYRALELVKAGTTPTETTVAFTLPRESNPEGQPVTLHYLAACVKMATELLAPASK